MPRKTTRNFLRAFAQAGINYLGRLPMMSDDIQLVSVLDDWSDRGGGRPRSLYAGMATGMSVSGSNHGIIQLEVVNPNGIILDQVSGIQATSGAAQSIPIDCYVLDQSETFTVQDTLLALLTSGPGIRTLGSFGSITDAQLFSRLGRYIQNNTVAWGIRNFPIFQGRFFCAVWGPPGSSPFPEIGILFHEIPDDDPPT